MNMVTDLRVAMYLITNVVLISSIMTNDMVLGELNTDKVWNMAGHRIQHDNNCSLTVVREKGLVLSGHLPNPCGIQVSTETIIAVEISPNNSSIERTDFLVKERLQGDLFNCSYRYVLIDASEKCVTLFQNSRFQLHLHGNFTVYISLIETNRSDEENTCRDVTEVNDQLNSEVSHLNNCQITQYDRQINCNGLKTNVCNPDFSSTCKATLGYRNVEFHCSENDDSTHKSLFIYPDMVVEINVTRQNIINIHENHFQGLTTLNVLILDYNYLNSLHPNVFKKLNSLKYLSIERNELTALNARIFKKLKQLTFLSLTHNNLANLTKELFHNLTKLRELHVSENKLQTIHHVQFRYLKNLKVLKFSGNLLTDLPENIFIDLENLQWLFFARNKIVSFDRMLFNSTKKLVYLSGGDNNFTMIPGELFKDLSVLETIKIYRCHIKAIPSGLFKGLTKVKKILFYGNEIKSLNSNLFNDTKDLEYINFIDNNLTYLPSNLFAGLKNLKRLSLDRNEIGSLNEDLFLATTKLEILQLLGNRLTSLPPNIFQRLVNLKDLRLFHNQIISLDGQLFQNLTNLKSLFLFVNNLTQLPHDIFMNLRNLEILRLENNTLTQLSSKLFLGLDNLVTLFLSNNSLYSLSTNIFKNLQNIKLLDLSGNRLQTIPDLKNLHHIQYLNVHDNPLKRVTKDTFNGLSENTNIIVSQEEICTCYVSNVNDCTAINVRSPYQTCDRVLSNHALMILMWLIGLSAIAGNVFVLRWNKVKSERDKVQSFLLSNLATSDLLMGIYMIIIASADIYFWENFPMNAEDWRSGVFCRMAGTLSIVSCEASVFFVTFISIDRFIHIKYPFTQLKLGKRSMIQVAALLWTLSLVLGIVPSSLAGSADKFYDNSHVCVGLPLAKIMKYSKSVHYEKITPIPNSKLYYFKPVAESAELGHFSGMYFSVAMFLGLNGICYIIILFCYVEIVRCVIKSSKLAGLQKEKKEQIQMTMKVAAIVLTDFFCWFPIIVLGILVQTDVLILPPSVFAWCVTVILPINSAINPYLYTISTILSNRLREARTSQYSENLSMTQRKASTTQGSYIETTL